MTQPGFRRKTGLALTCVAALVAHTAEAGAAEKLIYASYISEVYSASKTDIWLMSEIEKRTAARSSSRSTGQAPCSRHRTCFRR
jgi:hypothetical protein